MALKAFIPSPRNLEVFDFIQHGRGNALINAVAGSGKTTSILRSFPYIPENRSILYLVFNKKNEEEMKSKLIELSMELGRSFSNVRINTFHAYGNSAMYRYYRSIGIAPQKVQGNKCWNLFKKMYPDEDVQYVYASFVCDLVSYAKGEGLGVLKDSEPSAYHQIIDHHDMRLEKEGADIGKAIGFARELMAMSYKAAKTGLMDFDDMLFMPLALNLDFFKQSFIFGDEMQDTNPVRRELIVRSMNEWSRFIGVGDPCQAIYGFTGATNDAMELLQDRFNATSLLLDVSYRCPKAVVESVQKLVPYFKVNETNRDGDMFNVTFKEALPVLTDHDAILCRNVAPLISLAFKIIRENRACHVLGSEIGKGLVKLVKQMDATDLETLSFKISAWRDREMELLIAQEKEAKAEAVADKAECILVMIDSLSEESRSVEGLISKIQTLFKDDEPTLCLSSMHRSKGREWENVIIYRPELCPSPWAKKPWMQKQERNLEYVARTRAMQYLMFMEEVK